MSAEPLPEPPPEHVRRAQAARLLEVWKAPSGWRYWSEVNNTAVGLWYTGTAFLFFIFAGVLALLMRAQLAVPHNTLLSPELYNQAFTVHGSVMMFLFAIPIFEAFAMTLMPQTLGARDLPFPRLAAFGFWCFLLGGVFLCGAIFFDAAPRGGWFMYPPLTSAYQPDIGADIWLLGFSFIEIAAIASAVELIVGALKCRPPGMRLDLMPLYVWYTLVAAVMILFAFPPLIAGSLLLELERAFGWPFFDATRGGDPLLWQHLFWLFGHPEVYIVFLPSVALIAMIVPTFSRRAIVGYSWVVLSAVGIGFLSFGLWVHHMYTTGLPGVSLGFFSAASSAVAIPTGIQLVCFVATLLAGQATRTLPLLWVYGSIAIFILGGLTGVMVAISAFDFQAHDTFFVVAHFHYALIGGAVFPIIAGVYYYYPILMGRLLSRRLGTWAFWLAFAGFNIAFMPMHWSGLLGMPRRVFTYPPGVGLEALNLVSTIGAAVLALGFGLVAWDVVRPKSKEAYATRNPWQAGTLEWAQEMPGAPWGIRSIPLITHRYPLWEQPNLVRDIDEGRFYLPDAEEGWRETLVTSPIDATPQQLQRLPGPSFVTLAAALTTGGFFVFGTFHWWRAALASLALSVFVVAAWLWRGTGAHPEKERKDVGLGLSLPIYVSGPASVSWWGVFITMLADLTAFMSLIFGYFFFWTVRGDFPPKAATGADASGLVASAALTLGAWACMLLARWLNRRDLRLGTYGGLGAGIGLAGGATYALLAALLRLGLDPASHSYPATVWVLVGWCACHLAVGVLMQLYCVFRRMSGRLTARYDLDLVNTTLYWHFVLLTLAITLAVVGGFPRVMA